MAEYEDALRRWLKKRLEDVPSASSFTLRQLDAEEGDLLIEKFIVGDKIPSIENKALELLSYITEATKNVAKSSTHITKMMVSANLKTGKTLRRYATFKFNVAGQSSLNGRPLLPGSVGESEPPTEKGMTAQMMRHVEAVMRMSIESQGAVMDALTRENARISNKIANYEERYMEVIQKKEELMDESHRRHLETVELENQEERRKALLATFQKDVVPMIGRYLPGAIEKFTGIKALPEPGGSTAAPTNGTSNGATSNGANGHAPSSAALPPPSEGFVSRAEIQAFIASIPKEIKVFEMLPPQAFELFARIAVRDAVPREDLQVFLAAIPEDVTDKILNEIPAEARSRFFALVGLGGA